MILISYITKFRMDLTLTNNPKLYSTIHSTSTKHSFDYKLPPQPLLCLLYHYLILLPPEPKPSPWTSVPTTITYLQKNELTGWLKNTATNVIELTIWFSNALLDSHSL